MIGVTGHREHAVWGPFARQADVVGCEYVDAVMATGAQTLVVPAHPRLGRTVFERLDAVLLTGGTDIDSRGYGQEPHPANDVPMPYRDAAELLALDTAAELGLPVLAICRGAQLLNVWCGGTLTQHLPDRGLDVHGSGGVMADHRIAVRDGSWLAASLGSAVDVRCHHHQALERLGSGLRVTATAEDGVVEAVELEAGGRPVIGVQWHPEEGDDNRLVQAFVDSVRAGR